MAKFTGISNDVVEEGGAGPAGIAPRKFRRRLYVLLASLILVAPIASAVAAIVSYTFDCTAAGCGQYFHHNVTVTVDTNGTVFNNNQAALKALPWWTGNVNSSTLAQAMATSIASVQGNAHPDFVYSLGNSSCNSNSNSSWLCAYEWENGSLTQSSDEQPNDRADLVISFKDLGPNPEINGARLPLAALLVVSIWLFRFRCRGAGALEVAQEEAVQ